VTSPFTYNDELCRASTLSHCRDAADGATDNRSVRRDVATNVCSNGSELTADGLVLISSTAFVWAKKKFKFYIEVKLTSIRIKCNTPINSSMHRESPVK
jgi:hypothetical protein